MQTEGSDRIPEVASCVEVDNREREAGWYLNYIMARHEVHGARDLSEAKAFEVIQPAECRT